MALIGAHVKREDALATAEATGSSCIQLFLSDPQSWKKPQPHPEAEALRAASIPVYVHAPYIVNVASPDNRVRIPSRKILQQTMDGAAERIAAVTGRIDLVHANDSKDAAGSGRDRHEHLGAGQIDPSILVEVVRNAAAPVICETSLDGVAADIAFLHGHL